MTRLFSVKPLASSEAVDQLGYDYKHLEPVEQLWAPGTDWVVRNHKGSLVWVSREIPSIDIDDKSPECVGQTIEICTRAGLQIRLYETCGGLRVLFPMMRKSPVDFDWEKVEGLRCDPLYKALVIERNAWKSRLTTKKERSGGVSHLGNDASDFGVCRLIYQRPGIAAPICPFSVDQHDEITGALSELPHLA